MENVIFVQYATVTLLTAGLLMLIALVCVNIESLFARFAWWALVVASSTFVASIPVVYFVYFVKL